MPLVSVELFTGAGGLALGTRAAGFEHRALVEWNDDACATLRRNVEARTLAGIEHWDVREGDVRDVDFRALGPVDLVAGGPPCQPFSLGGKHRASADARNMIPEFARAVRELAPRAFIMENVRGLLRPAFAPYFNYVLRQLQNPDVVPTEGEDWSAHLARLETSVGGLRYDVFHEVLNAADFGVPQSRERVFVVGFRADLGIRWAFPEATHSKAALLRAQGRAQRDDGRLPWRTVREAISDLPVPTVSGRDPTHRLIPGARSYPGHTGSPLDWPSKTLKAGVHGVPGGENTVVLDDGSIRYVTVREAARLQTFPDAWILQGAWSEVMRQIGNAVPMALAAVVAQAVAGRLEAERAAAK